MSDEQNPQEFDVTELDDEELEDVAGGGDTNCGCINQPCPPDQQN